MVQDIAYEHMSIPSLLTSVFLNVLSQQIKSKVNFDILHLKPIEFAQNCTVPCVFIIGKQDKLVYPKRVQQIFEAYKGKQKSIISSNGQHSSEREHHILKQCYDFIIQELRKNSGQNRKSLDPAGIFANRVSDSRLNSYSLAFKDQFQLNLRKQMMNHKPNANGFGKYNFDTFMDETRNEENMLNVQYSSNHSGVESGYLSKGSVKMNESDKKYGSGPNNAFNDVPELTEEEYQQYLVKVSQLMKSN